MFQDGVILNRRGVVMSLSSVHAWSLVAAVGHVNDCHHCCRCVASCLFDASFSGSLSQPSCEVLFDKNTLKKLRKVAFQGNVL